MTNHEVRKKPEVRTRTTLMVTNGEEYYEYDADDPAKVKEANRLQKKFYHEARLKELQKEMGVEVEKLLKPLHPIVLSHIISELQECFQYAFEPTSFSNRVPHEKRPAMDDPKRSEIIERLSQIEILKHFANVQARFLTTDDVITNLFRIINKYSLPIRMIINEIEELKNEVRTGVSV